MRIVHKELTQLKEYVNNAKEHPAEQVQQIADSIEEFGIGFVEKNIDYDKADEVPTVEEDKIVIKEGDTGAISQWNILKATLK